MIWYNIIYRYDILWDVTQPNFMLPKTLTWTHCPLCPAGDLLHKLPMLLSCSLWTVEETVCRSSLFPGMTRYSGTSWRHDSSCTMDEWTVPVVLQPSLTAQVVEALECRYTLLCLQPKNSGRCFFVLIQLIPHWVLSFSIDPLAWKVPWALWALLWAQPKKRAVADQIKLPFTHKPQETDCSLCHDQEAILAILACHASSTSDIFPCCHVAIWMPKWDLFMANGKGFEEWHVFYWCTAAN